MENKRVKNKLRYPYVYPKEDGVYFKEEGEAEKKISQPMGISYIKNNIETNEKEA